MLKPGDKIPIVLEIVRAVVDGEEYSGNQLPPCKIDNKRQNYFWAVPSGSKGPLIIICSDFLTDKDLCKRTVMINLVELLNCGLGY
jgi:hypothetical protein